MNIPAAQYVRMSREHQQYSIQNQVTAILAYAQAKGFEVVETYCDSGRSGLLLSGRPGLTRLLQDVISGTARYKTILVYDVSRWGRFQDCDEAAHYEFVCKHANIPVHYCAEEFVNDCALPNTALKALKRMMAAEYSRELGEKVFRAEKRWSELGFKQGGPPGYGLHRMLVSSDSCKKQLLRKGEVKYIQSDRVVLVPGAPDEVALVREIFRLVAEEKKKPYQVANELNRRGTSNRGIPWRHQAINRILSDRKYIGYYLWNRSSRRLGGPIIPNPESSWVVTPNAFEPVISLGTFEQAHRVLGERNCRKSNETLVRDLGKLLLDNGNLNQRLLRASPGAPSVTLLCHRFGTLRCAIELARTFVSKHMEQVVHESSSSS
jgi:DNA invertase Pin-like site-specific DNA recombinase